MLDTDIKGENLCVEMYDWFDYHGHKCIAFELLGMEGEKGYTGVSNSSVLFFQEKVCLTS